MMRVWEIADGFGFDNLRQGERAEPEPGPGEVKLKLSAASLNFRDLLIVNGIYNPRQKLPLIPVSDGCGEVVELGEGVTDFAVGDLAVPLFSQGWMAGPPTLGRLSYSLGSPLDGVMRDYAVFPEKGLYRAPVHLTATEAACLPCAAVTAWSTLVTEAKLKAGDKVLIQGTGGVSLFALKFAKLLGAEVIITSSSDEKLERSQELGADHLINYKNTPEWAKTVREIAGGRGVDVIVEVGGAGTLAQSVRALRMGGFIGVIGVLTGAATEIELTRVLMNHARLQGITVGSRDDFAAMARAIALHELRPVVDRTFGFDELKDALQHMGAGKHFGKIALEF